MTLLCILIRDAPIISVKFNRLIGTNIGNIGIYGKSFIDQSVS